MKYNTLNEVIAAYNAGHIIYEDDCKQVLFKVACRHFNPYVVFVDDSNITTKCDIF